MFAFQACLRRGAVPALFCVTLSALSMLILAGTAFAAAPKLINYQGRLTTAAGAAVADGVYTVRFRIYTDSTGGTNLWEETQPVQTKGGLFSVILGGSTAIPDTLFNSANRFLGLKVNLDAEISPRSRLVSTPYALGTPHWSLTPWGHIVRPGAVGIGVASAGAALDAFDPNNNYMAARFGTSNSEASYIELYNPGVNQAWSLGIAGPSGAFAATLPRKSFYIYQNPLGHLPLAIDSNGYVGIGGNGIDGYTAKGVGLMVRARLVQGTSFANGVMSWGAGNQSYGVYGIGGITGVGVAGVATSSPSSGTGIWGAPGGPEDYAGYFSGKVDVLGTLSKSAGSFKIDHPLDPANKYLSHSFVESPDMMNIYNGNVITDAVGEATITLPEWFEALNKDFRYQLTVIGQFAQAIVASKMANNQFTIKTDKPSVEVSWMVTGIRQDAYANAHRIRVEEDKSLEERGHYKHPELYGQPEEKSTDWARHPEFMRQLKAEREKANAH